MPMQTRYTDDWRDAVQMAAAHPETFEVPSAESIARLVSGDYVKICGRANERFWVEILEICGDRIVGAVSNNLVRETVYGFGDIVVFSKNHIYNIHFKEVARVPEVELL